MKNSFALFGPQWIAKTATLVVVVAGAATIAVSNLPEPVDHTVKDLPAQDVAAWTMPLDRYVFVSYAKRDYAEDLLVGRCLAAKGIDWGVPWQNVDNYVGDAQSQSSKPLTARSAESRGYHAPAVDEGSSLLWRQFFTKKPLVKSDQAVADDCFVQVRKTQLSLAAMNGVNQNASTRAVELADQASTAAAREPAVQEASRRWRTCLAPAAVVAGVGSLPASPAEMPSSRMRLLFSTDVVSSRVTPAETTLAKADVSCQSTSGYRKALYDAEYRLQSKVTATDAAILAKNSVDQQAFDRRLDRIIQENLPAKPAP